MAEVRVEETHGDLPQLEAAGQPEGGTVDPTTTTTTTTTASVENETTASSEKDAQPLDNAAYEQEPTVNSEAGDNPPTSEIEQQENVETSSEDNDTEQSTEASLPQGAVASETKEPASLLDEDTEDTDESDDAEVHKHKHSNQVLDEAEKFRIMEEMHIGPATEILFPPIANDSLAGGWDNLRWMSLSGSRRIGFSRVVFQRTRDQSTIFGIKGNICIIFPARLLVLYQHPQVLLLLRRATDMEELSRYTEIDLSDFANTDNEMHMLKHYWIAETALDLATCQLQLSTITTHYASKVIGKIRNDREVSCFAVRSPSIEQIFLSAVQIRDGAKSKEELSFTDSVAFVETSTTEVAITEAICHAQVLSAQEEAQDLAWKHQLISGTLFSFVLSGNVKALSEALDRIWLHLNPTTVQSKEQDTSAELKQTLDGAWRKLSGLESDIKEQKKESSKEQRILPDNIINEVDGHGYPPIYYACRQRMNEAMALFIRYGASIDYTAKANSETLMHVCARNLDFNGLQLLLQVRDRPQVQINAINSEGESALYVAVAHGRGVNGQLDPGALDKCITILKGSGGRLFSAMSSAYSLQHPLVSLALNYRKNDLAVLMEHLSLEFPLSGILDVVRRNSSVVVSRTVEESLAALYGYPLHSVLAKFNTDIKLGVVPKKDEVVGTIGLLLHKGFEVNERVELDEPSLHDLLGRFVGFSPIQLVAVAAVELEAVGPTLKETVYGELDSVLSSLAQELINGGARISLEAPVSLQRSRKQKPDISTDSEQTEASGIDRSNLKIDGNEHLIHLLGGRDKLERAQAGYVELGKVMIDAAKAPRRDDSSNIEDSDAKGGNNERSCAICWKQFSLLTRKHRCRISWRHVCEECSRKRVLVNGKEYRVSDGQYVHAKVSVKNSLVKEPFAFSQSNIATITTKATTSSAPGGMARARRQRKEAEEKANRESLFGGAIMEKASSFLFGEDEQEQHRSNSDAQMSGLMTSLDETRNALLERGDKLSSLNEKSEQMVSASEDFAKMATDLRKQSERGFFW